MQMTKLRDMPSCCWRALALIIAAIAVAMILSGLSACAETPRVRTQAVLPCPLPKADAFETPAGTFYIFDEPNMQKLIARLEGVIAGTCLPLPAPAPIPGAQPL